MSEGFWDHNSSYKSIAHDNSNEKSNRTRTRSTSKYESFSSSRTSLFQSVLHWLFGKPTSSRIRTQAIYRLPTELLIDIFSQCTEPKTSLPLIYWHWNRETKMIISQVCRRWREVIFSMSYLWADISVAEPIPCLTSGLVSALSTAALVSKSSIESLDAFLHMWIARAGVHPLSLSMTKLTPQVMRLILRNPFILTRCKRLELHIDKGTAESMLSIFSHSLTHLDALSLQAGDTVTRGDICSSPLLRHESVGCWRSLQSLRWNCATMPLPFRQLSGYKEMRRLRELHVSGPTRFMDAIRFIIVLCPEIVNVSLDCLNSLERTTSGSSHLTSSTIKSLSLTHDNDPMKLLPYFTLPCLTSLSLKSRGENPSRSYTPLTTFLSRSRSPPLEHLHVSEKVVPQDDFGGYITHVDLQDTLVSLDIESESFYTGISDRTLELLRFPTEGRKYLPKLTKLRLRNLMTKDGVLGEVVASRCRREHKTYESHPSLMSNHGYHQIPAELRDVQASFAFYSLPSPSNDLSDVPRVTYPHNSDKAMLRWLEAERGLRVNIVLDHERLVYL